MVLPSMQLFHKFNYFHINTLKKQNIACCPGFYQTVEISSFDSYSYHHHHLQTPEVNNASIKVISGSVPSKTPGILCTFRQDFRKCWRRVPPPTKILIIPNAEQKKWSTRLQLGSADFSYLVPPGHSSSRILWCELVCQYFASSACQLPFLRQISIFQKCVDIYCHILSPSCHPQALLWNPLFLQFIETQFTHTIQLGLPG